MKTFRPAFSALILAALLPLAFAQTPTAAPAKKIDASAPIAKADASGVINANFQKSHESFLARGKAGPIDVLFLGDSITAGWANPARAHIWESFYGKNQPANFGIGDIGMARMRESRVVRGHVGEALRLGRRQLAIGKAHHRKGARSVEKKRGHPGNPVVRALNGGARSGPHRE
jgi:hypothetical protein